MKARLICDMPSAVPALGEIIPTGSIEEGPDVFWLVRLGVAEPEDEECRIAAAVTPDQMILAQQSHRDLEERIASDGEESEREEEFL